MAVEGWTEQSETPAIELARHFEGAGAAAIIYTDINRDGAMLGHNIDATAELAANLSTPVIASGGVTTVENLQALRAQARLGIDGVIVGRALYDGAFTIQEALKELC